MKILINKMITLKDYGFSNPIRQTWGKTMIEKKTKTNAPEIKFKSGLICVNVWKNAGKEFDFYSVSVDISFKDKAGEWQKTNSLMSNDIPKIQMLLDKAYNYINYVVKNKTESED